MSARECRTCEKQYEDEESNTFEPDKFCSQDCENTKTCQECSQDFVDTFGNERFCSDACQKSYNDALQPEPLPGCDHCCYDCCDCD